MVRTMKRNLILLVLIGMMAGTSKGGIVFFNDKAEFDAATDTITIDFEGIVGQDEVGSPGNPADTLDTSIILSDVTFASSGYPLGISGTNGEVAGTPFVSALLFADQVMRP